MATGNSSSKRKSSSSRKKKSRKTSSEVKKRSRSHKRSKSKKLHHRDASPSYSDDSLRSKDSVSVSSSDSDVEYRRSRSRTRKEEKGSNRKRVRSDSLSNEDIMESPKKKQRSKRSEDRKSSPRRRKKSSKKDRSGERKKSSHKKHASGKSRREKSVDSMRSNSRSLSSPRGGSSSGEEREFMNSRGRSEVKESKSKRNSGKMSHGRENSRSRSRSRSCSSFSGHSLENRYCSANKYSYENYRGRLRSVAIANETSEVDGRDYDKEENKADIIQAYDDCPSSRSNDSLDGDRKKNASGDAYVDFKKRSKEDPKMFETALAFDNSEGNESNSIVRQKAVEKFDFESVLRKKALEKFEASVLRKSPEADDLEAILRQKALENLKKFRGGLQADKKAVGDQIDESENVAKYLSNEDTFSTNLHREAVKVTKSKETASQVTKSATMSSAESKPVAYSTKSVGDQADKSDSVAIRPSTEKVDVVTRTSLLKEADKVAGSKETVSRVAKTSMESKYATSKDDCQIPDKNHMKHESRDQTSTSHVVPGAGNSSLSQMVAGKATQNSNASIELTINQTKLNTSRTRISPSDHPIDNQTPIAQNFPATKVVQPEHIEVKKLDEIPRGADVVSSDQMAEHSEICESGPLKASSCITPMSEVQESKEQFEQKTMSVMRGGELVQVGTNSS